MSGSDPLTRTRALLRSGIAPPDGGEPHGPLDLLGGRESSGAASPAQALMLSRALPEIYSAAWRPALSFALKGPFALGLGRERRLAADLLDLAPGRVLLDVASGPGTFTRDFARRVAPDGVAVGVDVSATMLARAAREAGREPVAYVRADALDLPFADGCADAVCCFAALYLIPDVDRALDEMVRVLRPGGRLALLTSARPRLPFLGTAARLLATPSGLRIHGIDELRDALIRRGLDIFHHEVHGLAQTAGATKARVSRGT